MEFPAIPIYGEDLRDSERLQAIYQHPRERYWTRDWSAETYLELARAGFIAIRVPYANGGLLWLRIHGSYAVLDWENLRAGRTLRRWMKSNACRDQGFTLSIQHDLDAIINGISRAQGLLNWMTDEYVQLMRELFGSKAHSDFQLITVGLVTKNGTLAAGEIGYRIGQVYTSLSGFFERNNPRFNHAGNYQLYLLAQHLRDAGFAFWNLGYPHMQYKVDLGASILERRAFLDRWQPATSN